MNDLTNILEYLEDTVEKYADKIEVYCGIECEMYGDTDLSGFDYVIGALHSRARPIAMLRYRISHKGWRRFFGKSF